MHRFEIVWKPTSFLKHMILTQLISLTYYVRICVIKKYGMYPLHNNQVLTISKFFSKENSSSNMGANPFFTKKNQRDHSYVQMKKISLMLWLHC